MRKRLAVAAVCALGAALALALGGHSVSAQSTPPCDFLTGGGYIYPQGNATGNKANFAIGGGCKNGSGLGSPPAPYWGHLEYQDKGMDVKVHGTAITGYLIDPSEAKARFICGTGTTSSGNVDFVVRAKDAGEPGTNDEFDIQVTGAITYTTFAGGPHRLGGGTGGGGNIELHKPNNSNSGIFGGLCPALGTGQFTLTVVKTGDAAAVSTVTSIPLGIDCGTTCSASFSAGIVTLNAEGPGDQAVNITWTSGCDTFANSVSGPPPTTATCTVTSSTNRTVEVNFARLE